MTIFVHIPKTGGTSVHRALNLGKGGSRVVGTLHRSHERALDVAPTYLNWHEHFRFTIVRNPWDRAVSWYYWHDIQNAQGLSFNEWIYAGCPHHIEGFDPIDQLAYFVDEQGRDMVNYVGRYENLELTLREIAKRANCGFSQLEVMQKSQRPSRSYKDHYTPETAKLLAAHTTAFIERFGYSFE
jgi:hypothetical protein